MGIHPTIEAATIGMWDTMIVMIMALVVFGPRRLPQIGRQIGKLMYEFRKASNDFRFQMEEELRNAEEADRRQREEAERQRALTAGAAPAPAQIEALSAGTATAGDTEHPEDYAGGDDADYHSTYDEAAYEHYESAAPSEEPEPEADVLSVKPPATGAPVPAERPTSRASVPPAAQDECASAAEPPPQPEAPEFHPAGDEAALSHARGVSTDVPAPQAPPPSEAAAEREPAAHHG